MGLKYEVPDHGMNPLGILGSFLGLLGFLSDVSVGGLLDQDKNDSSKQESKAKNSLFKAPRAVGKAVAAPGLLSVFDSGKGQLC